jgi:hypothetical protein
VEGLACDIRICRVFFLKRQWSARVDRYVDGLTLGLTDMGCRSASGRMGAAAGK